MFLKSLYQKAKVITALSIAADVAVIVAVVVFLTRA